MFSKPETTTLGVVGVTLAFGEVTVCLGVGAGLPVVVADGVEVPPWL